MSDEGSAAALRRTFDYSGPGADDGVDRLVPDSVVDEEGGAEEDDFFPREEEAVSRTRTQSGRQGHLYSRTRETSNASKKQVMPLPQ